MDNIILNGLLKKLNKSPSELSKKNKSSIYKTFPVPKDYKILWADVRFGTRSSGLVLTDKALFIKADKETIEQYNKNCKDKKDKQNAIYHLIKWEYFEPEDFIIESKEGKTILKYNKDCILCTDSKKVSDFFAGYKSELEKFAKTSTATASNIFSDFESVVPANFSKINTKTGHGEMAEEALTILDKLSGKNAEVIGRTNVKDGADRLVDGIQIQTKYCSSGAKCIKDCFDKTTGAFRYLNPDGRPMQIEVPKDKYYEALTAFRNKIIEGKVPGVTNPEDASKYVCKGKLTYQQALNLCKAGNIESLTYDAATGFIQCSFALGITFLTTYIICFSQTGDKKKAMNAALSAGLQVFGLAFMSHIFVSQVARTTLTKQLIPMSTYLVKQLGYKATQNIVNAIRGMSGKGAISGAAASKQLAKILRSNVVTSAITFVVFSVPDTFNVFAKKISGAQYIKNMLSLIGTMAAAGGGTLAASLGAAKVGALTGTTINPGIGTAIGIGGGLVGGLVGGTAIKVMGDSIREDDSVILSRMFNGIVVNLVYEYMLQENEIEELIEKFNSLKPKEFRTLFKDLIGIEYQAARVDKFVRHYFEDIMRKRPTIAEPTANDIVELLEQFGSIDTE
ncbi:MAG: hypothetical protein H9893_10175 [Candidatus Niameybacter stercoravium]|nr:hypothetical protein [Candidatus Niameybacter stercoravium]